MLKRDAMENHPVSLTQSLWRILLLALAYFIAGRLGLMLAIPPGYATAIFPASGIALASLLLFGRRLWPGILLGSFFINLSISLEAGGVLSLGMVLMSAGIGLGASLQALVGVTLVNR